MSNLDTPSKVDDQIELMKKYVTFTRRSKIRGLLDYAGYYRLSRYGKYLLTHSNILKTKPNQDLLFKVYNFDVELRRLLFHYSKKAEIQFKNFLSNSISLQLGSPVFYLERTNYTETKSEKDKVKREANREFFNKKFYSNLIHQEKELRSNINKYPELKEYRTSGKRSKKKIPCWAAFSYFEFGTITTMYSFLAGDLRKSVLVYGYSKSRYGKEATKQMDTWLDAVRNLRNVCAHHSKLVGRTSSVVLLDSFDDNSILKSATDLFSRLYALKKILKPQDSEQLKIELRKLIAKAKFNIYEFNILPSNWEELFDRIKYL